MTQNHKDLRKSWCETALESEELYWKRVVFIDEMRFCIDGPDGRASYWHDSRIEPRYLSRHQNGGASIMVWGAFCDQGVIAFTVVDGRMDSKVYTALLYEAFLSKIKKF